VSGNQVDMTFHLHKANSKKLSFFLEQIKFPDSLSSKLRGSYPKNEPEWLKDLKNAIHIRLIESQRLLNLVPSRSSRTYRGTPSMLSTVSAYSDELAKLMQDKFKEYGTTSQSLDRTFPVRVVKQQPSADVADEQLRQQLNELESTRSRHCLRLPGLGSGFYIQAGRFIEIILSNLWFKRFQDQY
jgi:hypothetical protein